MATGIRTRLSASEGRRFGFTLGAAFSALGGLTWWRDRPTAALILFSIAGLLFLAAVVAPRSLGPVERAWMGFAHLLSKVTTPLFLGIIYFLVITPFGVVGRLFGRRPLSAVDTKDSFWVSRGEDEVRTGMTRQF